MQSTIQVFFKGKVPSRPINHDEPVAYGAAVQGAEAERYDEME